MKILKSLVDLLGSGRLLNQVLTVGAATSVAKAIGLVRDILLARAYGTDHQLDLFFLALVGPAFVINVFGESIRSALIPIISKITFARLEDVYPFLSQIKTRLLLLFLFLAILVSLAGSVAIYISPDPLYSSTLLAPLAILACGIIPGCCSHIFAALLISKRVLWLPSISQSISAISVICVLYSSSTPPAVTSLALALTSGLVCELIILALLSKQIVKLPTNAALQANSPYSTTFFHEYWAMVGGAAVLAAVTLINTVMASSLAPGNVSALNFGSKVTTASMSILGLAISTAIFPRFSDLVATHSWGQIRMLISKIERLLGGAMLLLTVLLVTFSSQIVTLLFARGSFDTESIALVSSVQSAYALQIPFFVLGIVYTRLVSASLGNRPLLIGAVIGLAVNVSGNFLLIDKLGSVGLALSNSISYLATFTYLLAKVRTVLSRS